MKVICIQMLLRDICCVCGSRFLALCYQQQQEHAAMAARGLLKHLPAFADTACDGYEESIVWFCMYVKEDMAPTCTAL